MLAMEVAIYRMGNGPGIKIPGKWERWWKMALFSRLSFPATEPPDPRRVCEGVSERVSEGFLIPVSRRTLQNAFKNPFENL